jgi:geranylgeranyl diphosphate/geranylgeranyl-bacteriochlorophyllide a reductase
MISKDLNSIDLGFDIVVVGAGAAGCAFANEISEKYRVLLIDSKDFPRKKACSGILVNESIKIIGDKLNSNILVSKDKLNIRYIDWDNGLERLSQKDFLNSDRFLLDDMLFNGIRIKKNVSFLKETTCIDFNMTSDKEHYVLLIESNGFVKSIICKYIIGCDGALSKVRRKVHNNEIKYYIGIQEFIKSDKIFNEAYFIFDSQITDFYSWVIPKGDCVEIGSLLDPKDSRERFFLFKNKLAKEYGLVGNGNLNSAIVLRPVSRKDIFLGKGNIFLCGEAAGLISPSSAEGISYAINSAVICAKVLNENNKNLFDNYSKACKPILDRLDKKFLKSKLMSNVSQRKKLFVE